MTARRRGFLARWLFRPAGPAPLRVRLVLFVVGLLALAGSYVVTGSEGAQVAVLFGLTFGVYPLAARVFGPAYRGEFAEIARDRNPPFRVMLLAILGLAIWWGAIIILPNFGLGMWFWFWVLMIPWLEFYGSLARRDLERRGADSWTRSRPVRDSAVAGAATALFVFLILILEDMNVSEAIETALACGVIVFLMSTVFAFAIRRSASSIDDPAPPPL